MRETGFILLFIGSVLISSFSQILLKQSAQKTYASKIREYLNVRVIVAYGLFFCGTVITMIAYAEIPLSLGPVLESLGFIFVLILGVLILKEKMTRRKLLGMGLIIAGILLASIFGSM